MIKQRLDVALVALRLVTSRSQAASWIGLGKVAVDGKIVKKSGTMVTRAQSIQLLTTEQYVSRAGLKLASVADLLGVDFADKIVLDVGSSTGGFTDYALQHGAQKVYAVDVGTDQLHPSLRGDSRIELHEKTDIRNFRPAQKPDVIVIDVSFVSLRHILPHIVTLSSPETTVLAMFKPQFEATDRQVHKGVIKNKTVRRDVIHQFERWASQYFIIVGKADSQVEGKHGNQERFYKLQVKT